MRRIVLTLAVVGLLGGALAAALNGLTTLVQADRDALVERFTREHQVQLERAAAGVMGGLDDVAEDVRFAGELLGQGRPLPERRAELEALLDSVGKYKAIAVYGADAAEVFVLSDRRFTAPLDPHLATLRATARDALARAPGEVLVSAPLGEDASGWLRVFASPFDDPTGVKVGVVAVLVDAAPLVSSLRQLGEEEDVRLLALGAHGRPLPIADARLTALVGTFDAQQPVPPGVARLIRELRAGQAGHFTVSAADARALGLPEAEAVALSAPIPVRGGSRWSVGIVASTQALRSHDRSLVARLLLVAGVLAGFFALLGVSATLTLRRDRELSETLRHAAELGHARDVIQKTLDHVPTGIFALSKDRRVSSANRAAREMLAPRPPAGGLESLFPDAPPVEVERLIDAVKTCRAEGRVVTLVVEGLLGRGGHFSLHSVPLAQPDDELTSLLLVDDLSLLRTLEEQLLRAEKLSTVGVLAAGIAHEIGTPLGIARGRAEYLAGKVAGESLVHAGLVNIVEQIDRVSRIIRQLLDFSRVERAATTEVALSDCFAALTRLLTVEAERRVLVFEVTPPGTLAVSANADQLQQVLINLLLNAFDASEPGQKVKLEARPAGGRQVELSITDAGGGMTEDEQRRIFDPFFTTKKRGQGTGLGLTIAAQIARNHGATISVASQPGHGTTVRLTWPAVG